MNGKLSAGLAALLLVLAILALAPFAGSARQLFVANADKVDGIHASRTARAGALLALNKQGKLPASVVPTVTGLQGSAGPAGVQGPKGDSGATGLQGPKGDTGATGLQGPNGDAGATGLQGPPGTTIATHLRNIGSLSTTGVSRVLDWPLTGGAWTQKAGETDLFFGQLTFTNPTTCDTTDPTKWAYGSLFVNVMIDGAFAIGWVNPTFSPSGAGTTQTVAFSFGRGGALFSTESTSEHTATAIAGDSCAGAGQDFTLSSLVVDVVAVS